MNEIIKVGIIICDRYKSCAGGKCLKSLKNHDGAFSLYKDKELELVGFTTCGGCPGGNIEYAPEEMIKNGADVIHFATGFVVGYPPCPYVNYLKDFVFAKYKKKVIIGTHPIPQNYFDTHDLLNDAKSFPENTPVRELLADEKMRLSYN
jgi:predicted metal-binding protein